MTIDALDAVLRHVITSEKNNALEERLHAAELKFEEESHRHRITEEFLSRSYVI